MEDDVEANTSEELNVSNTKSNDIVFTGEELEHNTYGNYGLGERYFKSTDTFKEKINQVDAETGQTETIGSIRDRAIILASYIAELNILPGSNIMVISRAHMDYTIAILGILFAGCVLVPQDANITSETFSDVSKIVHPKLIFADPRVMCIIERSFQHIQRPIPVITFGPGKKPFSKLYDRDVKPDPNFQPKSIDLPETTVACILATEGTRGPPKIVCISHLALGVRVQHFHKLIGNSSRILCHDLSIIGCSSFLLLGVLASFELSLIRVLPMRRSTIRDSCRVLHTMRVECVVLGTRRTLEMVDFLHNSPDYNVSYVKRLIIGGSPISRQEIEPMMQLFPCVINIYATAETGIISSNVLTAQNKMRVNSAGRLMPGVQAKIIENKYGNESASWGEIAVKYFGNAMRYLNEMRSSISENTPLISNGWVRTEDIGKFDQDGYLYLYGHHEDIIRTDGHVFSIIEVEQVLRKKSDIIEAMITNCDGYMTAFVVRADPKLTVEELY